MNTYSGNQRISYFEEELKKVEKEIVELKQQEVVKELDKKLARKEYLIRSLKVQEENHEIEKLLEDHKDKYVIPMLVNRYISNKLSKYIITHDDIVQGIIKAFRLKSIDIKNIRVESLSTKGYLERTYIETNNVFLLIDRVEKEEDVKRARTIDNVLYERLDTYDLPEEIIENLFMDLCSI